MSSQQQRAARQLVLGQAEVARALERARADRRRDARDAVKAADVDLRRLSLIACEITPSCTRTRANSSPLCASIADMNCVLHGTSTMLPTTAGTPTDAVDRAAPAHRAAVARAAPRTSRTCPGPGRARTRPDRPSPSAPLSDIALARRPRSAARRCAGRSRRSPRRLCTTTASPARYGAEPPAPAAATAACATRRRTRTALTGAARDAGCDRARLALRRGVDALQHQLDVVCRGCRDTWCRTPAGVPLHAAPPSDASASAEPRRDECAFANAGADVAHGHSLSCAISGIARSTRAAHVGRQRLAGPGDQVAQVAFDLGRADFFEARDDLELRALRTRPCAAAPARAPGPRLWNGSCPR